MEAAGRNRAGRGLATGLALGGLALAALVGPSWIHEIEQRRSASAVCKSVEAGLYEAAIESGARFTRADAAGRVAGECRCWALLHEGRRAECGAHLEALLASSEGAEWVPDRVLTQLVIESRRGQGRHAEAAALADRAAATHPHDVRLRELAVMSRSALEGEAPSIAALARRVADPFAETFLRDAIVLSRAYRRRGEYARAVASLGETAPSVGHPAETDWYVEKTAALAAASDLAGVQRWFRAWREAGGDPSEIDARYALCLSEASLRDPTSSWIELLARSAEQSAGFEDPDLVRRVHERWISHLLADGEIEAALAVLDAATARGVELRAISRSQIESSAREATRDEAGDRAEAPVRIAFRSPRGGVLLVSPPATEPPDTEYEARRLPAGEVVEVAREAAATPVRWVLREPGPDPGGAVLGSGAVWPIGAPRVEVVIEPRAPVPPSQQQPLALPEGDGRRRVIVLLLDCADWRLTQYLRARGELPFLDHLLHHGYRAVLDSRPALTAAALAKLVRPDLGEPVSFVGVAHRLGLELGGLASVGRNPLGFLGALLPESPDLFARVGERDLVAANMLFSHGGFDAGRSAEIAGPNGRRRVARAIEAWRPLSVEAVRRHPLLVARPGTRSQVESVASALDAADEMVRAGEVDLLLLRVEALDILTHALFGELTLAGQDDGDRALLAVYRYIDDRLAAIARGLDADDVLVVMSDHGIRNPMEHETDALFVAWGGDVPPGRAAGRPELRGTSRVFADLLGVETEWPDTGIASWAAPGTGGPLARLAGRAGPEAARATAPR